MHAGIRQAYTHSFHRAANTGREYYNVFIIFQVYAGYKDAVVMWQTKDGKPPRAMPPCGFEGEFCIDPPVSPTRQIVGGVLAGLGLIIMIIITVAYR